MRMFAMAVAAATIVVAGSFAKPAAAITLSGSDGLRHAIEDTDVTDKVHCRPGRLHHLRRWGWWDGCYRYNYFYFGGHRHLHRHHIHRHHVRLHVRRHHLRRFR